MKQTPVLSGLVVRAQSGYFDIETDQGVVVAQARGRHRIRRRGSDLLAAGDRVTIRLAEDGTGVIESIAERARTLSRRAPGREREQVIVANLDQAAFVFSCLEPEPNVGLLDRLLVVTEEQQIPTLICVNKIDLVGTRLAKQVFGVYTDLGYPVFYVSAKTGKGVAELRRALEGKLSVFAGPSGCGKTTLLNAIQPGLSLRTGEVSAATGKGKHTTVAPSLVRLKAGGYVADTPGIKVFSLWDIEPEELDGYFREMRPLVSQCGFSDCTHLHEPSCAIKEAVERGQISLSRYLSYQSLRLGDTE